MKILLAGTPLISVKAFEEVIKNFNVVGILTQPDRRKGRGMKLVQSEVAMLGEKYKIKIFKPMKVSEIEDELRKLKFDLLLTFAYGQWIPTSILEMGTLKPLNIHGSLLPKYRGAAPIHAAILNDDKEIGITLMEMIKKMDAGDMYFKAKKKINSKTTSGMGFEIISNLAKDNIVKWLKDIELGKIDPKPQGKDFTHAPKIEKAFGELTSKLSAFETQRRILALNPFPGAFKIIEGKRIKIFNVSDKYINNSIEIKCSDATIYATEFQWESKKRIML